VNFDSYFDKRTGFEFDLTSGGSKIDLILKNDGWDMNWNAVWDGKVGVEANAWVAEFRIPFSQRGMAASRSRSGAPLLALDQPAAGRERLAVAADGQPGLRLLIRRAAGHPRSAAIAPDRAASVRAGQYANTARSRAILTARNQDRFRGRLDAKIGLASNLTAT